MSEPEAHTPAPRRRRERPPPPLSTRTFERAARAHLDRYPSSVENLRDVLGRRARRICDRTGEDPAAAAPLIDETLRKLTESGLLDDRAYGEALVRRLRTRGVSHRRIAIRLAAKGLDAELAAALLGDRTGEADLAAAWIYARRRRLGPYRSDPELREARRERDLAALGRAGFDYAVASRVIEAADRPEDVRDGPPEVAQARA